MSDKNTSIEEILGLEKESYDNQSTLIPMGKILELTKESYENQSFIRDVKKDGWKIIDQARNPETGYAAIAYQDPNGEIIITHRGSDNVGEITMDEGGIGTGRRDWLKSDMQINRGEIPEQFYDADAFTKKIMQEHGTDVSISHAGHSLGGALAQLVAQKDGTKAVAFDPPGTKEVIENNTQTFTNPINDENFKSFVSKYSVVSNAGTQIGDVTKLNLIPLEGESKLDRTMDIVTNLADRHSLETISMAFDENHNVISDYIENVSTVEEASINKAAEIFGAIDGATNLTDIALGAIDGVEYVGDAIETGKELVTDGIEGGKEMLGNVVEAVGDGIQAGVEKIGDGIEAGKEVIGNAAEAVGDGIQAGKEAIGSGIDTIKEGVHNFKESIIDRSLDGLVGQNESEHLTADPKNDGIQVASQETDTMTDVNYVDRQETSNNVGDTSGLAAELEANISALYQNLQKFSALVSSI